MYLHDIGETLASFTKEDMQQGKHTDYENQLVQLYMKALQQSNHILPTSCSSSTVTMAAESNAVNCDGSRTQQQGNGGGSKRQRAGRRNHNTGGNGKSGRADRHQSSPPTRSVPSTTTSSNCVESNGNALSHQSLSTERHQCPEKLLSSESVRLVNTVSECSQPPLELATQSLEENNALSQMLPIASQNAKYTHKLSTESASCKITSSSPLYNTLAPIQGLNVTAKLVSQGDCATSFCDLVKATSSTNFVATSQTVTIAEEVSHLQHHHAALAGLGMSWTAPGNNSFNRLSDTVGVLADAFQGGVEDDDLDFDPFQESQLGLAEQMKTEALAAATMGLQGLTTAGIAHQQQSDCQSLLTAQSYVKQQPSQTLDSLGGLGLGLPPGLCPPPGFEAGPFPPTTNINNASNINSSQMFVNSRSLLGSATTYSGLSQLQMQHLPSNGLTHSNNTAALRPIQQQSSHLTSCDSDYMVKDMLRNMCPNANISFGPGPDLGAVCQPHHQLVTSNSSSSGNSSTTVDNHFTWQEDPAIVHSGLAHLSSMWLSDHKNSGRHVAGNSSNLNVPSPEASSFLEQFMSQCSSNGIQNHLSNSLGKGDNNANRNTSGNWGTPPPGFRVFHHTNANTDDKNFN